jgi:tRNA(fMet)-specific endonuclease VapC
VYLLDTDTLIYSLKGELTVLDNFRKFMAEPKAISVITYGELVFGAQASQKTTENLAKVYRIKEIFPLIDITPAVMDIFGALKADMRRNDTPIDDFDLLIGATALTIGYCVVTNNERHYSKIPGLKVVNWTKSEEWR